MPIGGRLTHIRPSFVFERIRTAPSTSRASGANGLGGWLVGELMVAAGRSMAAGLLVAAVLCAESLAQPAKDYPARLITMVVPAGAGGPNDLIARIVADDLKAEWAIPVVV